MHREMQLRIIPDLKSVCIQFSRSRCHIYPIRQQETFGVRFSDVSCLFIDRLYEYSMSLVSVGFVVVSLGLGNSVFPFGYRLFGHTDFQCDFPLGKIFHDTKGFDSFSKINLIEHYFHCTLRQWSVSFLFFDMERVLYIVYCILQKKTRVILYGKTAAGSTVG